MTVATVQWGRSWPPDAADVAFMSACVQWCAGRDGWHVARAGRDWTDLWVRIVAPDGVEGGWTFASDVYARPELIERVVPEVLNSLEREFREREQAMRGDRA